MNFPLPTLPKPLPATSAPRHPWYSWRRLGLNFLTISILAHLFFGVGATYFIVQKLEKRRKQTFAAVTQSNTAMHAVEHKVQMQKKQQTMSAPAAVKRITTTSSSKVALPDLPAMPRMDSAVVPVAMAGMGGPGLGVSTLSGSPGSGGGGGGGLNLFGLRGGGSGLEGTFYDYKMDQDYQPIKAFDDTVFARMVHDVLPSSGDWHPDRPYRHYRSPAKLLSRYFIFPAIPDTGAGAAFQSPKSGPGHWLAVYRGAFSWPTGGSFRFVGFGDNVMIVHLGNHVVLDASDKNYTGLRREMLGNIEFPGKDKTTLFGGEWISLEAREVKEIEIAVGDEGGIFCSGLFIQPKGTPFAQGNRGAPKLPVFMLGAATDADRALLGKYLLPESLQGPFFQAQAPPGAFDIFSH